MKIIACLLVTMGVTSCLADNQVIAQQEREIARPVIKGLESEPDIQDHFTDLLSEGFDSLGESDSIHVTDDGYEKFVVFDTGDELRMYLLVKDEAGYDTAVSVAVEKAFSIPEGEQVELMTTVLASNPRLLNHSVRMSTIQKAVDDGASLSNLALQQVELQDAEQDRVATASSARVSGTATKAIYVDCAGSGMAVCCGFQGDQGVRIICVCNSGSNNWGKCFDSGWVQ